MKKINNAENSATAKPEDGLGKSNNAANIAARVISIDAATKSLAVACLNLYDISNQNQQLINLLNGAALSYGATLSNGAALSNTAAAINELLTPITIHSLEVIDLIPNRQVSKCGIIERSAALMRYLTTLTARLISINWLDANTHLLIEYQMGQNRKSGDIQTQIIYHFLQYLPQSNIHIIGPSLKNKLSFATDPESKHSFYIAKYTTLYTANKSHTKYLFIEWLHAHNQLHELNGIKKKNYADIADAFCQAAAWQFQKYGT